MADKNILMQRKKGDGTYDAYYPQTKVENVAGAASGDELAALDNALDEHLIKQATLANLGHVNHAVLETTLNTTWTGSQAPYSKAQTINGILAADNPIIDVVMSGTFATDEARQEAWGYIYRAVTAANEITFYAMEKPEVELPLQIKVVR